MVSVYCQGSDRISASHELQRFIPPHWFRNADAAANHDDDATGSTTDSCSGRKAASEARGSYLAAPQRLIGRDRAGHVERSYGSDCRLFTPERCHHWRHPQSDRGGQPYDDAMTGSGALAASEPTSTSAPASAPASVSASASVSAPASAPASASASGSEYDNPHVPVRLHSLSPSASSESVEADHPPHLRNAVMMAAKSPAERGPQADSHLQVELEAARPLAGGGYRHSLQADSLPVSNGASGTQAGRHHDRDRGEHSASDGGVWVPDRWSWTCGMSNVMVRRDVVHYLII